MKQLLKKLSGNIDDSINFSTSFSYLSKPIGAAFFSIAYIQHTSVLWCVHVIFETHQFWQGLIEQ